MNADFDPYENCPYDPVHRIRRSRMQYHLSRCAKNYPDATKNKKTCIYDTRHVVSIIEYQYHIQNCPAKESVLRHNIDNADDAAKNNHISIDAVFKQIIDPIVPNFEDEQPVQTYNPMQNIENKAVVYPLIGASKAKRKQFRMQQRKNFQENLQKNAVTSNSNHQAVSNNTAASEWLEDSSDISIEWAEEGKPYWQPDYDFNKVASSDIKDNLNVSKLQIKESIENEKENLFSQIQNSDAWCSSVIPNSNRIQEENQNLQAKFVTTDSLNVHQLNKESNESNEGKKNNFASILKNSKSVPSSSITKPNANQPLRRPNLKTKTVEIPCQKATQSTSSEDEHNWRWRKNDTIHSLDTCKVSIKESDESVKGKENNFASILNKSKTVPSSNIQVDTSVDLQTHNLPMNGSNVTNEGKQNNFASVLKMSKSVPSSLITIPNDFQDDELDWQSKNDTIKSLDTSKLSVKEPNESNEEKQNNVASILKMSKPVPSSSVTNPNVIQLIQNPSSKTETVLSTLCEDKLNWQPKVDTPDLENLKISIKEPNKNKEEKENNIASIFKTSNIWSLDTSLSVQSLRRPKLTETAKTKSFSLVDKPHWQPKVEINNLNTSKLPMKESNTIKNNLASILRNSNTSSKLNPDAFDFEPLRRPYLNNEAAKTQSASPENSSHWQTQNIKTGVSKISFKERIERDEENQTPLTSVVKNFNAWSTPYVSLPVQPLRRPNETTEVAKTKSSSSDFQLNFTRLSKGSFKKVEVKSE